MRSSRKRFREIQKSLGKDQYLVNYYISAHPGATLADDEALSAYLRGRKSRPEQVQDFTPLPLTAAGCMYYTETHPFTGEKLFVTRSFKERKIHRGIIQYQNRSNRKFVKEARRLLARDDDG